MLDVPALGLAAAPNHSLPVRAFPPLPHSLGCARRLTFPSRSRRLIERYLERSAYGLKILAGDYYARTESEDGHGSDSGSHAELHQEKASHHPDGSLPSFLTAATLESVRALDLCLCAVLD